jgi:uncharacterized protein (TIGR00375 family)
VDFTADLHVHLGATRSGRPVKIGASRHLTLPGVLDAAMRKGIKLLGVVDFVPDVIEEAREHLSSGACVEAAGGGLEYKCGVTVVPGLEVEIRPQGRKPAHFVALFPGIDEASRMSQWVSARESNPDLSSQVLRATAQEASDLTFELGGTFWPAHAFTPHKGYYGSCAASYGDVFESGSHFEAIELGLSADTAMAGMLPEISSSRFVTASDCHGPETLAREFMLVSGPVSFDVVKGAARGESGAPWPVIANYGLDPRLGKYHRTACPRCGWIASGAPPAEPPCPMCGHTRLITGVKDRIATLALEQRAMPKTAPHTSPGRTSCRQAAHCACREDQEERPPYVYQVPLDFLPGVGKRTRAELRREFGDESFVLHRATYAEIGRVAGERVAACIVAARAGDIDVAEGGGGQYGRVLGITRKPGMTSSS